MKVEGGMLYVSGICWLGKGEAAGARVGGGGVGTPVIHNACA